MDRQAVQERFGIIGTSPGIRHVIDRTRQVARTDISVLIEGESGTGKELVAHAIHEMSLRRHRPLKIINTGAIPEGLIESELFGAERGAYTGATERRTGLFEEADGGSVFLDEIGEMPAAAQVRLLRVLETGSFNRVGSSTLRHTDTRVIAATNKNLGHEVEAGRFREDLYYRLSTVIIRIPPLRERQEDIIPLFEYFMHNLSQKYRSPRRQLLPDAKAGLRSYRWPGNVRELRNVAEQVIVLHRGTEVGAAAVQPYLRGITARGASTALMPVRGDTWSESSRELATIYRALLDIRLGLQELRKEVAELGRNRDIVEDGTIAYTRPTPLDESHKVPLLRPAPGERDEPEYQVTDYEIEPYEPKGEPTLPTLEAAERELINKALKLHGGNRKATATALGISPRTLYRKLKEWDEGAD